MTTQAITCQHQDVVKHVGSNLEEGICKLCGQVRLYDSTEPKVKVSVQVLGRIDGKVVLPHPGYNTSNLSPKDRLDLMEAMREPPPKIAVPTRPKQTKRLQKYFEKNRKAIISDYFAMPRVAFFKKWHMSAATWFKLQKLWKVAHKGMGRQLAPASPTTAKRQLTPELPVFPAFNDSWLATVQIEWLKTYKELRLALEGGDNDKR